MHIPGIQQTPSGSAGHVTADGAQPRRVNLDTRLTMPDHAVVTHRGGRDVVDEPLERPRTRQQLDAIRDGARSFWETDTLEIPGEGTYRGPDAQQRWDRLLKQWGDGLRDRGSALPPAAPHFVRQPTENRWAGNAMLKAPT